jgi:hypothetical protein
MGSKANKRSSRSRAKAKSVKKNDPKWSFSIRFMPEYSPMHLKVCVHETRAKLWANRSNPEESGGCEAFFRPINIEEVIQISKDGNETRTVNTCFGEMHFYPGSLTFGIITHEIFHAVIAWAWENGFLPKGNEASYEKDGPFVRKTNEEMCAELMTVLVGQFMHGMMRCMGKKFLANEAISA